MYIILLHKYKGYTVCTDKILPVTGYKLAMVRKMTQSGSIPQFGYCDEVKMDALIR